MATLKQRLHRKNSAGTYDTIHYETSSDVVMRPSGRSVEQDLAAYLPEVQDNDNVPESLKASKLVVGKTKGFLRGKALSVEGHTHDDRYYTESEVNDRLSDKANSSHNHSASNITSGTLPIARGGTGATSASAARSALGAAAASHTHDDRYYTESEINTKLNTKISTPIRIDPNTDLNTITECGFYYCDGANNPNRPVAEGAFSLLVENTGAWGGRARKQTFTPYNHNNTYTRIMTFYPDGITNNWNPWDEISLAGHAHDASNITSGILPVTRGGTGVTSIDALKSALGIGSGGTSLTYRTVRLSMSESTTLYDSNCVSIGVTRLESSGSSLQGGSYYSGMIPYSALKLPYSYSGEIYSVEALGYVRGTAHTPVVLAEINYRENNKSTIISCPDNQSSCILTIIES